MSRLKYQVLDYDFSTICNLISNVTSTPFHRVYQKRQLNFINQYIFENFTSSKVKVIIELDYVEEHYLIDYSDYYVKSHREYGRFCTRIHFFENDELTKNKFKDLLNDFSSNKSFLKSLQKSYAGYIVLRPLPETFLAKVCLKEPNVEGCSKVTLSRSYKSSLFGIELKVDSIAFQEKDKVLSACATSALWSLYNVHPCIYNSKFPSPNTITKEAFGENIDASRFLNGGLSSEKICRSMQKHDLEPRILAFNEKENVSKKATISSFIKYVEIFCDSKIPVILSVNVLDSNRNSLGNHAVCVIGYYYSEGSDDTDDTMNIICHDDRNGPFTELKLSITAENYEDSKIELSLSDIDAQSENANLDSNKYVPEAIVVGLYHKIRILYPTVEKTCGRIVSKFTEALHSLIDISSPALNQTLKPLVDFFEGLLDWNVELKLVANLKNEILTSTSLVGDKEEYLAKSWPKYIWSAKLNLFEHEFVELLFDATDIPQGRVFLDILYHSKFAQDMFVWFSKGFDECYAQETNKNDSFEVDNDCFLGFLEHFRNPKSYADVLDETFGDLNIPKEIKDIEVNNDLLLDSHPIVLYDYTKNLDGLLKKSVKYIWLIDEDGGLILGEEPTDESPGHPTLVNGKPARIGGELIYDKSNAAWIINSKSGRFSSNISIPNQREYLENVKTKRFEVFFRKLSFEIQSRDVD